MQVLRQILNVKSRSLKIYLPSDFTANRVEVIVLPMDEEPKKREGIANLRGKLKLTHEQYTDFQNDVQSSREEWERDI
ncbi:MAG: hypothetical protein ABFD10_00540 [Prolixibacteraceae bacterium]